MATVDTSETLAESGLPITPDQPGAIPALEADVHQPFRFTAAASFSAVRKESLVGWHRSFLRIAAANLRSALRLEIDLEIDTIQLETCSQLLAERDENNQALIFRMDPQPDLWLLDLPLPFAVLAVERMMGGVIDKLPATDKSHELTELEQIIFQQFAATLLGDYARNWQPHREIKPEIIRPSRALRSPRALGREDDDLMVRVGLSALFNESKVPLSIFLPIVMAEELLQRLGTFEDSSKSTEATYKHDPKSPISAVPVPVSVRWQGFQITLAEVAALQPGDVLVLDNKKCDHGVVYLGDRARFAGKVVREAHKTLITLSHPLE